jgi:type II restriction enzyme
MLSLIENINDVKNRYPKWKSNSRIVGQAGEDWIEQNYNCLDPDCKGLLQQYNNNQPGKDLYCTSEGCGRTYQVKTGKSSSMKFNCKGILNILGAEYSKTLANDADYIFIGYSEDYDVEFLATIENEKMKKSYIVPRKPLSLNARRAGWQGCYIKIPKESLTLLGSP